MKTEQELKESNLKKYRTLPEDWRNDMMARETEDLYKAAVDCCSNIADLDEAEKLDMDLASLKEQAKEAGAVYKEGKKNNNLKIGFVLEVLRSRGEKVSNVKAFMKNP